MNLTSIPSEYLGRSAAVYIRQSQQSQVIHNQGSAEWQAELSQKAARLGWPEHRIQRYSDEGVAASVPGQRPDFLRLLHDIGQQQIGAVFLAEGTRAARNLPDWSQLIELCSRTKTLIYCDERLYNPADPNDMFTLGITQVYSVAISLQLRARLDSGKSVKIQTGTMKVALPVGYERDRIGRVVMTTDADVRNAIQGIFADYARIGSATSVASEYLARGLQVPRRKAADESAVYWVNPDSQMILQFLKNPSYAGAYRYYKAKSVWRAHPAFGLQSGKTLLSHGDPRLLIVRDTHAGYISWLEFDSNQRRLQANRFGTEIGWAREGAALLQGLAHCGSCGRKMTVHYSTNSGKSSYRCDWAKRTFKGKLCQFIVGAAVEDAVSQLALQALQPAQIDLVCQIHRQQQEQADLKRQQQARQLRQLEQQADEAKMLYVNAVRREASSYITTELEEAWEDALKQRDGYRASREGTQLTQAADLTPQQLERLRGLGADVQRLWQAPELTNAQRKQLLRTVIARVDICKDTAQAKIVVVVHWHSGQHTGFVLGDEQYSFRQGTPKSTLALIRELSAAHTQAEIARQLNARGIKTDRGHAFKQLSILNLQRRHKIPSVQAIRGTGGLSAQLPPDTYNLQSAADILGISVKTVKRWHQKGVIAATEGSKSKVWLVHLLPERIAALRAMVKPNSASRDSLASAESSLFQEQSLTDEQWEYLRPFTIYPSWLGTKNEDGARVSGFSRIVLDRLLWRLRHGYWKVVPNEMSERQFTGILRKWSRDGRLAPLLTAIAEQLNEPRCLIFRDVICTGISPNAALRQLMLEAQQPT